MRGESRLTIMLLAVILSALIFPLAAPAGASPKPDGSEMEAAMRILAMADAAERRVKILINLTLANATVTARVREAGLEDELNASLALLDEGRGLLAEAHGLFNEGNYTGAIHSAMEAMKVFREVYRSINRILCEADVKKFEVLDGQGLLEAMNRALMRMGRIEMALDILENRTHIDVSDIRNLISEARALLNTTRAEELLREGRVSEVAHMLAEANRKISEAIRAIRDAAREAAAVRIERLEERIREACRRVRQRLREMNISESRFFRRWGAEDADEFSERQIEALERVRARIRERGEFNATELKAVGERMRELNLELEFMFREREGAVNVEVELKKTIVVVARNRVTATLRVTVRNSGNVTVTFPNSAFGIVIERWRDGAWEFYHSPISLQVLRDLEPGESGEVTIRLIDAPKGAYRVVVHASGRDGPQGIVSVEFQLP